MFNSNCASVPLVASIDGNGNNSGAWGDGGQLWIIVVFALLFGWGNNGFVGGFGGGNAVAGMAPWATQADVRAAVDQQTLISKIDQQTYGMADSFTALNNTLNNNFRTIDNAICTLGYQNQQGFNDANMAMMQNTNAIQSTLNNMAAQNAACCCETQRQIERGFADTNYNMATQACETRQAIADGTDIVFPAETIVSIISTAGKYIGIGTQRANGFGRYHVADVKAVQYARSNRRMLRLCSSRISLPWQQLPEQECCKTLL